jgi:hypothetical protein
MKLPENSNRTGLSTSGLVGTTILAGVIFADLSAWWLIASAFFILAGIGLESGKTNSTSN